MAEKLYVYNAKVSIRSKLEILQTSRSKLSWKEDRLDIFSRAVFGPWLNIQTTLHDNHLLNFLLQHQRFISKPSTNQPFIFDIDDRTLEYGMEDFCLITGFQFGKVNLDPDEEDHSEFRMRVFPKIENLKGEHLLELVNKDVKFAKLNDEDNVRVCSLLALDFVFMGHEFFYSENSTVNKLIPSTIEMNELWWRSSLDYFKKVTHSIPVLRSATKGSSKGKSFHTRVRTEVRHEVHVRTEVSRVHSKEEVHVPSVEKKDIQERDELLKTVKEQKQMIIGLQVRLNSVEEKLKPGPSDVDHLDKTNNLSKNAPDCGLDQQSMGGVNQCMNVDEPYKNWNDVSDNFHANGLDHKSVEGVSQCTGLNDEYESIKSFVVDSPQFKVKDNEEACHSDFCLSTQQVRELINDFFHTPSVQVQDACVSELLDVLKDDVNVKKEIEKYDVHVDSFVKEDIEKDDVQFDSVVKDAEQIENETLPRQKFPGKAYLSPYIQPSSTEVKCRKRRREIKLEKDEKKSHQTVVGLDGVEIKLLPWKEDVTRSPTAPKRTMIMPEEVNALFRDKNRMEIRESNADWAIASPYLCDMLSRFQYPLYYVDGVKYGVPWFAKNVQKVYFPINENDSHWVLGELHISSGLITIYDSLGCPPNGIETRLFWLDLKEKLQFQIPLFLDNAEVFEKKDIIKDDYLINFQFADGVPI
ncbi:phospholipase-like protein [Tanacetum coccineum]